jgi:glycosyltransferase involved in cell wall biosynthesis
VLYLIDSLAPGGAERSLAALAPHYRDLGVSLEVVTLIDRDGLEDELRSAGARVFPLGGSSGRTARTRRFAAMVREHRPDLVHTTLFESDVVGRLGARMAKTAVVSSLVNEAYGPEHAGEAGIRTVRLRGAHALDAMTARLTTRLHAVSKRVADVMAGRLRYPRSRIDVVRRGRDAQVLGRRSPARATAARSAISAPDRSFVVLAVARHEPQKSLDTLVDAFARLHDDAPDARLYIAGREGASTAALRERIGSAGLESSVVLLGQRDDVPDLLCAADVFVLPSRREGMPGSVIEAMALEAPVVASDLPQVREVTGDDAALLVPVGDAGRLADALVECRTHPSDAERRVHNGFERFESRFTIEATSKAMVDFYARCAPSTTK